MLVVAGKEILEGLDELVDPKRAALLVIDVQNDFCSPGGICDRTGQLKAPMTPMIENTRRLIAAARAAGVRVIYIQNTNYPDRRTASPSFIRFHVVKRGYGLDHESTLRGTWGWQFVDEIAPLAGDIVIEKHRSNAFIGTGLDMLLRSNGIETVVLCGTATHGCVESSARAAEGADYYVVLCDDACAAFKQEQHDAAILVMRTRMEVVPTAEVAALWRPETVENVA